MPFTGAGLPSFLPTTPAPSATHFPSCSLSDEIVTFSGGAIAVGNQGSFFFNLALPDSTTNPFTFTFRETPNPVPEPSALAALGLGAGALIRRRKRA